MTRECHVRFCEGLAGKFRWATLLFGGGPPDKFAFVYHYNSSRSHGVALSFLEGFEGYLHCDGFSAYDTLAAKQAIRLVGCWYHSRRKFVEAQKVSPKQGLATQAIRYIKKLSLIERDLVIRKLSPDIKAKQRHHRQKPILKQFKTWLEQHAHKVPEQSLIGKAIHYTLRQWPKLMTYLEDGRLEFSNNRTERGIKPFAVGRKNWMFSDSVAGAEASSTIYSLIETCKAHKVEPYTYLRQVLSKLPNCETEAQLQELLPYNINQALTSG